VVNEGNLISTNIRQGRKPLPLGVIITDRSGIVVIELICFAIFKPWYCLLFNRSSFTPIQLIGIEILPSFLDRGL
jgi:hypothetical protein